MTRVLILSSRLDESRRQALEGLAAGVGDADIRRLSADPPAPDGFGAIVIDGGPGAFPLTPTAVQGLHLWVRQGGSLLVIGGAPDPPGTGPAPPPGDHGDAEWARLVGAAAAPVRSGEWIVKVDAADHPAITRIPAQIPLVDGFQALQPTPEATVLLTVNVAFRDQPAVISRRVGAGCVTTAGLGNQDAALADPELSLVLRRCLAAAGTHAGGLDSAYDARSPHRIVGMGIVGYGPYGGMGLFHGLAAQATQGLELVAACDSDPGRRKAAEEDFAGLRSYATVEELASDDDVEVVIVATPPVSHAPLARALLRAGKHVALEKPMCLSVAEADDLIALAHRQGLCLTVNQNRRWDPDYLAIRRVIHQGLLGEVFSMETFVGGFEHPCRAWHSEASVSGGAVYDWGSHHLDWAVQLMGGPPETVAAYGHKRVWHDVTNLDQIRVHLAYRDGREAEFIQSDVAAVRKPKFYLQGTAGTLAGHYRPLAFERIEAGVGYVSETAHHAEAPAELTLVRYESAWGLTETRLPPLPQQRYAFHRNLADHLQRGEPLAVTPESVRPVIAVIAAAECSAAAGGKPVALDL